MTSGGVRHDDVVDSVSAYCFLTEQAIKVW